MKHMTSILVCEMDDATFNMYVNGVHCYKGYRELQSPESLAQKVSRKAIASYLSLALGAVTDKIQAETAAKEIYDKNKTK